ncbi:hypothetical protein COCON_G00207740 [Conger conger]|uniref:Uncharacterized protein n=1 Tax=Conger conger TaxID=82655 RepID=A0A9Q1D0N5_CONCO|nr:hypothetical protein COCON_G00207740 [Conger conger]
MLGILAVSAGDNSSELQGGLCLSDRGEEVFLASRHGGCAGRICPLGPQRQRYQSLADETRGEGGRVRAFPTLSGSSNGLEKDRGSGHLLQLLNQLC